MVHRVRTIDGPWSVDGARIHMLPAARDNLMWLLECTTTRKAAVIDGPPEADPLLALCERLGVELTAVWNTHTHHDHIGINLALQRRGALDGLTVAGPARRASDVPGLTLPVDEGDALTLGRLRAQVWLTEGHLDGHVSFVLPGAVFCGDTLFTGGCGRLFDGPASTLFRSLLRLASLPPDTLVFCAHAYTPENLAFAAFMEPDNDALAERIAKVEALRAQGRSAVPSTIAEERATNPFLRVGSPTIVERVAALGGVVDTPEQVFASLRALKDAKVHLRADHSTSSTHNAPS